MSLKSYLSISAGAIMLLTAVPALASSSWPSASLLAAGTADNCAAASAQAQDSGHASDAALANCTMAVKLAIGDTARAQVLNNRSVLLYTRGEYDAALNDNTAALKINDRMAEAIVNRGSIHPEKVYFNRALAREDMGDKNGAYADYAQASRLAPQWDQPKREMTRFTTVSQKPIS
jgi:tetratricopeptide (TPR) repeat protein